MRKAVDTDIGIEHSPVGESRSNGAVENAIQRVQGQFRTMKFGLEERYGRKVPSNHVSLAWLVPHAAHTMGRYRIGRYGKTPHELLRGRPFDREVVEFGECVDYLGLGSKGKDKQDSRWKHGVWFGIKEDSGEVIIGTEKGITKARDVHRRGDPKERWN